MKTILPLLLLTVLCGCSAFSGSKSKSQSLETAERFTSQSEATLRRATTGNQPQGVALKVEGKNNTVTFDLPPGIPYNAGQPAEEVEFSQSTGQKAGTDISWLAKSKWTIPLGVSILLVGVGLLVLWFALGKIKRSSVAAASMFKMADETIAGAVERIGAKMPLATDPAENARLASEMSILEKARRKLHEKRPPIPD